MRAHIQNLACLAVLLMIAMGCASRKPWPSKAQKACANSVTERFVTKYVRPLSDPVALLAHKGADLPAELLASNRVTCVEVKPRKGESRILFQNESRRPPDGGMTTGVDHARNLGVYYPVSGDQKEIEVRMNYFCDIGDFVAVHVVVPNPSLLTNRK